jgi:2-(1,2-epoxy-1,2-dihydrophenyl)acetyl-CoA isomerase
MQHEHVRLERQGAVATVTLDRPGTRNACSMSMWLAIRDAFRELAESDARVVVLTGANGDFCSGADIVRSEGSEGSGGSSGWEGNKLTAMRVLAQSVLAVHDCPIPIVAKVDGYAVGAGFGLALAADLLWCSDRARLSAVFAKLGLSLDYGSSWLLAQRIGVHKAKELAFTAEMMDAARADRLGLVNAVVPAAELDDAVAALADRIAAGAPMALSMTKRMLDHAGTSSLAQALETEALAQNVNLGTEDLVEALTAFSEKRPAVFHGR